MPPFWHTSAKLRTLVDPAITAFEIIFGGGGDIDAMMRLTVTELLRVTEGEVVGVRSSEKRNSISEKKRIANRLYNLL